MGELINFDGLGDIVVNLTNKLADGIGWIANKENPKKLAVDTYIKDIQESNYDSLTKAALISNAKKIIKEYCNQNDIVNIAIQSLQKQAVPEEVEDDWIGRFMDKARLISAKEFQWIWGKILARECNKPGSIPFVLLYTLEKMDKEDAEVFTTLCRISVQVEEDHSPVIIDKKLNEYKALGITYDSLVDLCALGLIEMDIGEFSTNYVLEAEKFPAKVIYYDKEYELSGNSINVGNVIYTKSGEALCRAIDVDKLEGFWETYCLPLWEEESKK